MRTYPGLLLLGAVVGGILFADLFHPALLAFLLISLSAGIGGIVLTALRRNTLAPLFFALSLGGLAGLHYAHLIYQLPPSHYHQIADPNQVVQVYGEVADWPELKPERTEIIVEVDSLGGTIAQRVTGRLLLRISDTTTALQRGDAIEFFGRIYLVEERAAQGQFDYNRYLNLKGIFGTVYLPGVLDLRVNRRAGLGFYALTDRLRDLIRELLYANLSPSSAALASGFLIGETRDIPVEIYQMFRDSGTLHLMAVSGSNVAVVLGFFILALTPFSFGRKARAIILLTVVVLFATLSYGEPSVMRASVMAALVIVAGLIERRINLNNIIALSMLLILLVDPPELFDVGFQLSFVTAWGLIFVVPKVTSLFRPYHNRRWYRWIFFPLIVSLVAQLVSAPLIGCYFGKIPLVSLAANLVIVPLASAALVLILMMLVIHAILPIAGLFVGRILDLLLQLLLEAVKVFGGSELPSLQINVSLAPVWWGVIIVVSINLIGLAAVALGSKRARRWLLAVVLIGLNIGLVTSIAFASDESESKVFVNTVPGGVMILSQPSSAESDLIITGLTDKPYQLDQRIMLPWLRSHQVDSLRYCILLSGNYHALDDFVRLTDSLGARRVYVASPIEGRFRQVWRELGKEESSFDKVRFFGADSLGDDLGYSLHRKAISISLPQARLLVGQTIEDLPSLTIQSDDRPVVAIIGKNWKADPTDWLAYHANGLDEVICSRIAQRTVQNETDAHAGVAADIPDYIHQLSLVGEIQINLRSPLRIRPR
ncbi:MAG: ComEC family competence protein [bacterium]|nr:ComEC family competence protein [bacterium]